MSQDSFKSEFLKHYLSIGIGALSKKDIDALVMHLLDQHGKDGPALNTYSNQDVSALLKAPVSKIKSLRYEAALKYGGSVETQAKAKLLSALSNSILDAEAKKVCLIIEDALAKNWLQGQLKINGHIFDSSFNTEIIKMDAESFFSLIAQFFDKTQVGLIKQKFDQIKSNQNTEKRKEEFVELIKDIVKKLTLG